MAVTLSLGGQQNSEKRASGHWAWKGLAAVIQEKGGQNGS